MSTAAGPPLPSTAVELDALATRLHELAAEHAPIVLDDKVLGSPWRAGRTSR